MIEPSEYYWVFNISLFLDALSILQILNYIKIHKYLITISPALGHEYWDKAYIILDVFNSGVLVYLLL